MLAVALLAIAGCGLKRDPAQQERLERLWLDLQQQAAAVDSWNLRLRAAITYYDEAYNVSIRWEREGQKSMMLLEAPFGQGVFSIDRPQSGWYRLRLPDGREFSNEKPEALLQDVIGWSLPISGLEFWIRGLPHPNGDYSYRLDDGGSARSIRQDDWDIDYLDYFADASPRLPRRMRLEHDELTLKLVIERWQQSEVDATPSDLSPEFN